MNQVDVESDKLSKVFETFIMEVNLKAAKVVVGEEWLRTLSEDMFSAIGLSKTSEFTVGRLEGEFDVNVHQALQFFLGGFVVFTNWPQEKMLYIHFSLPPSVKVYRPHVVLPEIVKKTVKKYEPNAVMEVRINSLHF